MFGFQITFYGKREYQFGGCELEKNWERIEKIERKCAKLFQKEANLKF